MEGLRSGWFQGLSVVSLGALSYAFADVWVVSFIGLLILFGFWNLIYLLVVPRTRFVGGIIILIFSMIVFAIASLAPWTALVGLFLFGHGNWLAFVSAARLDE
jgi:hypothetical protein